MGNGEPMASRAGPVLAASQEGNPWTRGLKRVLVMRADSAEHPGNPQGLTAAQVQAVMDKEVAPFYAASSRGLLTLEAVVTKEVFRLPKSPGNYALDKQIHDVIENLVRERHATTNFDLTIAFFPKVGGTDIGGRAAIGGSWSIVNGTFSFRIVSHELGHNLGLDHANLWQVTDGDPVSPSGESDEYEDPFDVMGRNTGSDRRADFNPWFKSILEWYRPGEVIDATPGGLFRIFRFDHAEAQGPLALRISTAANGDYWVGLRGSFTNNASLSHGAYIIRGRSTPGPSVLIDVGTPGTDTEDCALPVGEWLIDEPSRLGIRVVGEGGTGVGAYLDVQVSPDAVAPRWFGSWNPMTTVSGTPALLRLIARGVPSPTVEWEIQPAGMNDWTRVFGVWPGPDATRGSILFDPTWDGWGTNVLVRATARNAHGTITTTPVRLIVKRDETVSTLAGKYRSSGYQDGGGSEARFEGTGQLACGVEGDVYVSDSIAHTIRRWRREGIMETVAGHPRTAGASDGKGRNARFYNPAGLAVDAVGKLYVADRGGGTIRRMDRDRNVSTWAGEAYDQASLDGPRGQGRLDHPFGIAVDSQTNVFVTEPGRQVIRRIDARGELTTWAGVRNQAGSRDGRRDAAEFNDPGALAMDRNGVLYVGDRGNRAIRRIAPDGQVTTLAREGTIRAVNGLATDPWGGIYVASGPNTLLRVGWDGIPYTAAGGPFATASIVDGNAAQARFASLGGIALDSQGRLYLSDAETLRVHQPRLTSSGNDVLVRAGSNWKYYNWGPSPDPTWIHGYYRDGDWANRNAEVGYGEGDERSLVPSPTLSGGTAFPVHLRHRFWVADPEVWSGLRLRLLRDDGAAVYLNGYPVHRSNLPTGDLHFQTEALRQIEGQEEGAFEDVALSAYPLARGENVVAVAVYQARDSKNDMSFDLQLEGVRGEPNQPPAADAGADRWVATGTPIVVSGRASDDGRPPFPGHLGLLWRQLSGPTALMFQTIERRIIG